MQKNVKQKLWFSFIFKHQTHWNIITFNAHVKVESFNKQEFLPHNELILNPFTNLESILHLERLNSTQKTPKI